MKSLRTGWTRKDKRDGVKSYSENQRDAEKKKGMDAIRRESKKEAK